MRIMLPYLELRTRREFPIAREWALNHTDGEDGVRFRVDQAPLTLCEMWDFYRYHYHGPSKSKVWKLPIFSGFVG